jgi:hypothetical protein
MKVNKIINLRYVSPSSEATAFINVNFPVKSIHIKSITYSEDVAGTNGGRYITLVSDLTNGEPLGSVYVNSTYSSSQFSDISFQPSQPETINGTYTFTTKNNAGNNYFSLGDAYINVILEFNGVDTADT